MDGPGAGGWRKGGVGCVCSLANYSVAYEESQSNRVSDFRDFVCSLFPKAILFFLLFSQIVVTTVDVIEFPHPQYTNTGGIA